MTAAKPSCVAKPCNGDIIVTLRISLGLVPEPQFESACVGHIPILCQKLLSVYNAATIDHVPNLGRPPAPVKTVNGKKKKRVT